METESFPRAEEALRLLAAAVGAARLYPPASALPKEATSRFVARANELAASGPLRYIIERHGVRVGTTAIAPGQSHVVSLAEALHAMQVGQLVIAPGVTESEVEAFVSIANSDPSEVRAAGGVRTSLTQLGVRHMAVIEVSLRSSDESGLLGLDLTAAPLDEIATEVLQAAENRATAASEGPAEDEVAEAIGRLEDATRAIAMERVATALMRLDEKTRMRVLGLSLKADTNGSRMDGLLDVIARMKPAALARLLTLFANQAQTDPKRIAAAMELPPETARILSRLLTPSPDTSAELNAADNEQIAELADEMTRMDDHAEIERQVSIASPALSAGRALATATAVSRTRLDAETIRAIGDVLPQAARDGAFPTVREALRRLDEIGTDPSLSDEVRMALSSLADPEVLRDVCRAPQTDADAAIAGEIIQAAGQVGAEALLDTYIRMGEPQRSLLRPVLRGSSEMLLGVARSRLRTSEPAAAIGILRALSVLGDRRVVAVIAESLDSSLEESVRFTAASALASMPVPESVQALIRALGRGEVETQRHVVRELGRIRAAAAVPSLARTFDDVSVLAKSFEMRKDIIAALTTIGTPDAEKALRRFATRPGFGRKSRELKKLALDGVKSLPKDQGVDAQ